IGPIAPQKPGQDGAFFFLGYQQSATARPVVVLATPPEAPSRSLPDWNTPLGTFADTVDSNVLRPRPVTFRLPESYKMRGVDLSSQWDGTVDLRALHEAGLRFAYLRATNGRQQDRMFARAWSEGRRAELLVGAYHMFMLCSSADEQFEVV